jgi:hypothetical protein
VVPLQLIEMRTGLERATSCHDHDGFQASPRQILRGAVHDDVAPNFTPRFVQQDPKEKNYR